MNAAIALFAKNANAALADGRKADAIIITNNFCDSYADDMDALAEFQAIINPELI